MKISKNLWIVSSGCLSLIFFSIAIFFLTLHFHNIENRNSGPSNKFSYYQYQETSPHEQPSYGFVSLPQVLSDDDFISYYNPSSESSIIISNFASTQYVCYGSCSCSESIRRFSSVMTRSLYLLLSATSSSLALKISTKSFRDQCLHHFSEQCDGQNIHSEVTSCSETHVEENNDESEYAEYFCRGHCLPKKLRAESSIEAQKDFFKKEGECNEFETSKTINIKRVKRKMKRKRKNPKGDIKFYQDNYRYVNEFAKETFLKTILVPFCKEMTRRKFLFTDTRNGKVRDHVANFCVAGSADRKSRKKLSNVRCKLISQSYKSRSRLKAKEKN